MKTAIYARVSTGDQQTLPLQIKTMRDYAKKRKWKVVEEFKEVGSGANDQRPKRAELLSLARQRKIDAVVVMRLDRWGRSMVDIITTVNELVELDVVFVSVTNEYLDMTSPYGKILMALFAGFAETERALLSERVKEGIAHAKSKGKRHGRPATPQKKVREVKRLFYTEKMSRYAIAKKLKLGYATVHGIIKTAETKK